MKNWKWVNNDRAWGVVCVLFGVCVTALCFLILASFNQPAKQKPQTYPLTTKVVRVDYDEDIVVCQDFNGNEWTFNGCEDWAEGDIASLLMNDKGTTIIYDDEIIDARYSGWFEGWQ
jgi:hypothetical protein